MKGMNTVIAVALVAICLLGWMFAVSNSVSESSQYNTYVSQADEWLAEGLYQRAIGRYQAALAAKPSEQLYEKILAAYQARMQEAPEETEEDYQDFLEDAVVACPANEEFVKTLAQLYFEDEKYTKAYTCLREAVDNGINSDEILLMLRQARYAYSMRGATYTAVKPPVGSVYTVAREDSWGTYSLEEGYILSCEYEYVSQSNVDGVVVVTDEKDSRLIDGEGVVLGIFSEKVTDAGVFSEGLIAAKTEQQYFYYDEFAKEQFGGYEQAGAFQDGLAAVKQNGTWVLVDTQGQQASEQFAEIVLNMGGGYITDNIILAAQNNGSYVLYDDSWEVMVTLDCENVDILTEDGVIAVCKARQWGFVNTDGEVVIEHQYEQARSFSNGLAAVCENGLWGFIDTEGNLVIDFQFSDVGYFDAQGVCAVRTDLPQVVQEQEPSEPMQTEQEETQAVGTEETQPQATEEVLSEENEGTQLEEAEEFTVQPKESWNLLVLKNGIVED